MYSLLYCEDIKEYYICKTKNVIQEDDGVCLVTFRAKLILSGCASKHNLQRIQKSLLEDPTLHVVPKEEQTEEAVDNIVSIDLVSGDLKETIAENEPHSEIIIDDNKTVAFAENEITMNEEETSYDYNEMADLFTTTQYYVRAGISGGDKTTDNKTENEYQQAKIPKLKTVSAKLQKKTYICCFCKLKPKNFVKHMLTFHKNEDEVKKLSTFPKNTPERLIYLRKMKMKATNYSRIIEEMNNRHNIEELHTRNRSIIKPSKYLKLVIGSKLKLEPIYSHELFVLFGNIQCERFHNITQIRTQLQVLANVFKKLLKNNSNTSDLRSVFHPENMQNFLNLPNKALRKYETRYLIKFGKFLVQYYASKREFQKKIDTEEAVKFLYATLRGKRIKNDLPERQLHLPMVIEVKKVKRETETKTTDQEERMPHLPIIVKSEKIPKNESEQTEDTQNKSYSLRQKARDSQRYFLQEQMNNEMFLDLMDEDDTAHVSHHKKRYLPKDVNEESEDTQNKSYSLRQRARDCQRFYLQEQMSNEVSLDLIEEEDKFEEHIKKHVILINNKRYIFCVFCENLYVDKIIGHLERIHAEEEDVKKFASFPKGSVQRKQMITEICQKGINKYKEVKLNRNVNDLMKRKRKKHIPKKTACEEDHNNESQEAEPPVVQNININNQQEELDVNDLMKKKKHVCEENQNNENQEPLPDVQDTNVNNQKEELDVQDINQTTDDENTDAKRQWKELEEYFEITTHDNKLEYTEDDTKESLMCMLAEHVNCSPTC